MPQVPLVLHRQSRKSIECRHRSVPVGSFLKSGKAVASLVSIICVKWKLKDLLIPMKCLKTRSVYPQEWHTILCKSYTWKNIQSPDTSRSKKKKKAIFTVYCCDRWQSGRNLHCSRFHQWGDEPLLCLARTEGDSWPQLEPLNAMSYYCWSSEAGQEFSSLLHFYHSLLHSNFLVADTTSNHSSSISIITSKNIHSLHCWL